jgi:hypothetical protein
MTFGIFEERDNRLIEYIPIENDTQYLMANLQKGSTTVLSNSFLWELVNPQYKRRKKVPGIANPPQTL